MVSRSGFCLVSLVISLCAVDAPSLCATPAEDIATIKQRLRDVYVAESTADTVAMDVSVREDAEVLAAKLTPEGAWPDVEYHEPITPRQVGFKAFPHVARLRKLAAAYATAPEGRREALAAAIHRGIDYWLKTAPDTGHLWYREIGAPIELGKAAIMFDPELNPEERAGVVRILQTCRHGDGSLFYSGAPATGQNLIWDAGLQIMAGCLMGDSDYIVRYKDRAEKEMLPTPAEGVQSDWSFHQHGALLSSGASYGMSYVTDCARLAVALRATPYSLAPTTIDLLVHCVLDGQQWMTRGRSWDFSAIGRNIVWPHVDPAQIAPACEQLAELVPARSAELRAFARRLRGQTAADSAPVGNRWYWKSEYMTHLRPGFYASARMSSRRILGNESGNGQGERTNFHLGDGACAVMVSGDEYRDIFPVWDWRRIPGVTCVDPWPRTPLPANIWGIGSEGGSDFAGGVSDGEVGAAAMELERGGAKARKAWFFFENAVVCLGAAIQAIERDAPLITCVNQCWAHGKISFAGGGIEPANGDALVLHDPGWIQHDHIAYLFPEGGDLRVARDYRSGVWQDINAVTHVKEAPAGEVFSVWFEHERGGKNNHYAYIVAPNLEAAQVEAFGRSAQPKILANHSEVQAVASADGSVIQLIFWQAGRWQLPDGRSVEVDHACALLLRRSASGAWTMTAGDPNHKPIRLLVRVATPAAGGAPASDDYTFKLADGDQAGSSLSQSLAR